MKTVIGWLTSVPAWLTRVAASLFRRRRTELAAGSSIQRDMNIAGSHALVAHSIAHVAGSIHLCQQCIHIGGEDLTSSERSKLVSLAEMLRKISIKNGNGTAGGTVPPPGEPIY